MDFLDGIDLIHGHSIDDIFKFWILNESFDEMDSSLRVSVISPVL